ncbi:class I SAM-dependent methyltransferase [Pelagibacteraceae bacterium]|nr:class I SAM-dependent methyltransferase [Pelagibacteraceae bacterium]
MIESLFNYKFKEIIFEEIKKKIKDKKIRILEIGTFDAKFTNWLSKLFPDAEIITIDIDHNSENFIILEKSSSFTKELLLKNRKKHLKRKNIKFIQMNSLDLMKKFSRESFDIIFVDGYHKNPIVSHDIKNSHALIKKNGYVVVDDLSYSRHMNSSLDGMNAFKKLKNTEAKLLLKHVRPHNYFFKSYVGFYQKKS